MHGADSDVLWLQRDFGLYVVALFDTGQAARVLQFSSYSLAYLLERYAGVAANKKFALADWRIRPLGDEMIRCAVPPPPAAHRTHTRTRDRQGGTNPATFMRDIRLLMGTQSHEF